MKTKWMHFRVPEDTHAYLQVITNRLNTGRSGKQLTITDVTRGILKMFVAEQRFRDAGEDYDRKYRPFIKFFRKLGAQDDQRLREIYEHIGPVRPPPAFDWSPLDDPEAGDQ